MPENFVLYDGDCYFCSNYVEFFSLKSIFEGIELLDARANFELAKNYLDKGVDLNRDMVIHVFGRDYVGPDAMVLVSTLTKERKGILSSLNSWIFSSPKRAKVLYPVLVRLRLAYLKLTFKDKIKN